jgi:tRNA nucleotidyltransferase (CCA-adding enzyme)
MDFKKKLIEENTVQVADYSTVISKLSSALKKRKIQADVVIGGSVAKSTNLKHYDMDIFVQFYKNPDSDLLEAVLKKEFARVERLHGSRDYFKIHAGSKHYEIVPVLKIAKAEQAENVTDVSMLHVKWVKANLKNPGDVKLAKLFCRAQHVYGAESFISGFSGYFLEILIVYYGSFEKMIKAAAKWKPKVVIDAAHYYTSKEDALFQLNASKTISPVIVIDPVQKDRNAGAAVSIEKFDKFVKAAQEYTKKPSEKFFAAEEFSAEKLKKEAGKNKTAVILKAEPVKGKLDVVYSKIVKVQEHIKQQLELNEFSVHKTEFEFTENIIWFIVSPVKLPSQKKHLGPKADFEPKFIDSFKKKYKNAKLEKGRYADCIGFF